MTFLPIVERELRVATRRRLTYWSRPAAAAVFAIGFGFLLLVAAEMGGAGISVGELEFSVLKWGLLIVASLAGVFVTADTLSEEKREGTMGLLFLTDLRGYDIVIGKLVSHSVRVFYGMLAVVPIVGLVLMMGGVTGREFWQVMLVIGNSLVLSLALGMFISSLSRDSMRAMLYALLLSLAIFGGLQLLDMAAASWDERKFTAHFSLASPGYLLVKTGGYGFKNYWLCLGIQHGLAWVLLGLASFATPRTWRDKPQTSGGRWRSLVGGWRFGSRQSRAARRRKILQYSPVLWLVSRDRSTFRVLTCLTVLMTFFRTWGIYLQLHLMNEPGTPGQQAVEDFSGVFMAIFVGAIFFWLAGQACRFFVEAMQNGAMELILVTPVSPREIIRAQRAALRRVFLFPVLCTLLLIAGSEGASFWFLQKYASAKISDLEIASLCEGVVLMAGVLAAVSWFGMWAGMTSRKMAWAVLKTLGLVVVTPYIALGLIQNLVVELLLQRHLGKWGNELLVSGIWLLLDLWFILRSRAKLLARFRELAARDGRRTRGRFWARWRRTSTST